MMAGFAEWGTLGSFLSGVAATLALLGGLAYWTVRRAVKVATKSYVKSTVDAKIEPIEERLDHATRDVEANQEDLRALTDLLEGGNSQFEKGMMDFLEENIDRTVEIQEDLTEIKGRLTELRSRVETDDE
ncbi:hypothetical protein HUG10_20485 (plasmid) [Halorarum halophilum]|uniref:Uncharacterized protein n=1 Tax=Halorarum halophilum TaxID=2743090 RepID=A0A7D5GPK1_9EURY|nr:hypothetical protein [Halobaculum halophilum]QLG29987.1 hypothetical protein HUG10_20485 [Halobaculum halophilum]